MSRVVCAECGYANSVHRRTCKNCRTRLPRSETVAENAVVAEMDRLLRERADAPTGAARFRYLVYPFVAGMKSGQQPAELREQLQKVIDHYGGYGWDFYGVEKLNVEVQPGCLGALLGQRTSYTTLD